jgi:hypothetical protein
MAILMTQTGPAPDVAVFGRVHGFWFLWSDLAGFGRINALEIRKSESPKSEGSPKSEFGNAVWFAPCRRVENIL